MLAFALTKLKKDSTLKSRVRHTGKIHWVTDKTTTELYYTTRYHIVAISLSVSTILLQSLFTHKHILSFVSHTDLGKTTHEMPNSRTLSTPKSSSPLVQPPKICPCCHYLLPLSLFLGWLWLFLVRILNLRFATSTLPGRPILLFHL